MESYIRAAPKAELHVHLEGSIQPSTLLLLAERNGVGLPVHTLEELQRWFTYRDFDHFIDNYVAITECLKTAEDYELIAHEFGAEMARQNVRYAEVTFTPATHELRFGVPHDTYFSGLTRGRQRAQADFGVEIQWVFDLVQVTRDEDLNRRAGEYTTRVAIEGKADGVVALGLGGVEIGHSFERIAPWFDRARAAGLHSAPHAGETIGAASIWGALQFLGAERIGHGVRAVEDPALVAYLAEHSVPLEVCPTSNIRLGIYDSLDSHPLRRLYDAGVTVTVNSDDPPLFNTTLTDELATLIHPFDMDLTAVDEIILNAVRHSFLPPARKQALETTFRSEMDDLASHFSLPRTKGS